MSDDRSDSNSPEWAETGVRSKANVADMKYVGYFWFFATSAGLLAVGVSGSRCGEGCDGYWPLLFWALGLEMSGGAAGFLFGIPKVLQQPVAVAVGPNAPAAPGSPPSADPVAGNGRHSDDAGYQLRVNTNLEEISDWLTKIIVGLGLMNLRQLPAVVNNLAERIAGPAQHSVALAVIVFFVPTGFLCGYLLTRLYLQGALARAERDLLQDRQTRLKLESATLRNEALGSVAAPSELVSAAPASRSPVDDGLRRLANEYMAINAGDYRERVALKNRKAIEMYRWIVDQRVSRDALVEETDEGLLMALATAIHAAPQRGDDERLLGIAGRVTRLHVKYRIVLAIGELVDRGLVSVENREKLREVLKGYLKGADTSLQGAIQTTLQSVGRG